MSTEWKINKEAFAKLSKEMGLDEMVEEQANRVTSKVENMTIVMPEKPSIDQYRETRITWEERLGESGRTLEIETYTTAEELLQLVRELLGVRE